VKLSATRWTLIQAAQAGDTDAVRMLCEKYWPAVVVYLRGRGLGPDAEDVAQESLVALLQSALAKADRGAGRFRGLVFSIARNHLLKHVERQRAQKRGGGAVQTLGDIEVATEEPDEAFDREWLGALVQNALGRLASEHPPYFEALRGFVLDEKPQATIATELGVSVGVVKKRVHRGKKKLAIYLQEAVWRYACGPNEYESELAYLSGLLGLADDQPT
jgi:RNA polymerase sigma factor (sigma-70 family)